MDVLATCGGPIILGRTGENDYTTVVFPFDGPAGASVTVFNRLPGSVSSYPVAAVGVQDGTVRWTVSSADLSVNGYGECEITYTLGDVVAKSVRFPTQVIASLDGQGDPPEGWDTWEAVFTALKAQAEAAADAAEESANDAQAASEAIRNLSVTSTTLTPGSPLNVVKTIDPETGVVTLTFYLAPGKDGISPTVTVTDITGGHRITITDADGPHSIDVLNGESGVQDVRVNGTSVVQDGVANVPVARSGAFGLVKPTSTYGVNIIGSAGEIGLMLATDTQIKAGAGGYLSLIPGRQHTSTFYGLAKAAGDTTQSASSNVVGQYTESAKSAISTMLNAPVSVTGSTPTINALPGVQYVCGEVSTMDIILPASGCVDVRFESGSTATVLTITPPSGVTVKWANGFDPTSLDANTVYEINICDGLGVAASWT